MIKQVIVIAITTSLIGCASNPRIEDLSREQRVKVTSMKIYEGEPKQEYQLLGTVSGISCNRNKYQAQDISEKEGIEGLKIQAAS